MDAGTFYTLTLNGIHVTSWRRLEGSGNLQQDAYGEFDGKIGKRAENTQRTFTVDGDILLGEAPITTSVRNIRRKDNKSGKPTYYYIN